MRREWIEKGSILWVLFWGAVALDSALVHRRTREAIDRAVDADPYVEEFDGPPRQHPRVNRWLLWQSPTVTRLRELCHRAEWWKESAKWLALAGPPLFFAIGAKGRHEREA